MQAAHPSATKTEIWERSSTEAPEGVGVMEMGELVDAALIGYDRREAVTIPPLQDEAQWNTFNAARTALIPGFLHGKAASRYQTVS